MATTEIDQDELYKLQDAAASALPWQNMAIRLGVELHSLDPNNGLLKDEILSEYVDKELERQEQRDHDPEFTKKLATASEHLSPTRRLVKDDLVDDVNAESALEPEDVA